MFWTLSEPDQYLTLELITRKTSDPVSQICSDTGLAAISSDFLCVKTKEMNPSEKVFWYFSFLQNSPLMSASYDACPNHAPGPVKLGRVTSKWKQCGEHGTVREQRLNHEKGWARSWGDPNTGKTMLLLTSAKSRGDFVGPGWWQWQM